MPYDLGTLLNEMVADQTVPTIARNPAAQFGRRGRRYLGAELLPEMMVNENAYREEFVRYRTVVANDGTRYSPVQKKDGDLIGSFLVELAHSDIGRELSGRQYDNLLRYLQTNASMEAVASITNWLDTTVNLALVENNERMRWEAIVGASVALRGANAYAEAVAYSNPSSHRAAAGGTWSSDAYDPFDDILAMVDLLKGKGFDVNRIITSQAVVSILSGNDNIKARTGVAVINASGQITSVSGRANLEAINGSFARDGLPPLETYDLLYRTSTGTARFMPSTVMVFACTTGRDEIIDLGDDERTIRDTLGYTAIGVPAGQPNPGRVIRMESFSNKPPRIEAEGWQASLPVITEPEAIAVITGIG